MPVATLALWPDIHRILDLVLAVLHRRRGPRHGFCRNASCRRRGWEVFPTLRACPGCGQPLSRGER
jgi:hypothetical protein